MTDFTKRQSEKRKQYGTLRLDLGAYDNAALVARAQKLIGVRLKGSDFLRFCIEATIAKYEENVNSQETT